jgi:hypothetical protein
LGESLGGQAVRPEILSTDKEDHFSPAQGTKMGGTLPFFRLKMEKLFSDINRSKISGGFIKIQTLTAAKLFKCLAISCSQTPFSPAGDYSGKFSRLVDSFANTVAWCLVLQNPADFRGLRERRWRSAKIVGLKTVR